jgi:hypothetical protein
MTDNFARSTAAPRKVTLGGVPVYAGKLTPNGWGVLQAFFMDALQSPLEQAREAIHGLPDNEAAKVWVEALSAFNHDWPPALESSIGSDLLSSPEGKATLVYVACRGHNRRMTRERAAELADGATPEEMGRLIALMMPGELGDLRAPDAPDDQGLPYTEVRAKLCKDYPGWTYATVDAMTFDQIRDAWHEGKARGSGGIPVESEEQVEAMRGRNWRDYYVGL